MQMHRLKFRKNLYIQLFTWLFCTLTLIACGGSNRPKNVHRNSQNQPGKPQKPTTETGVNAAGYMAYITVATKQLERALDFAINQNRSKFLHECQKDDFVVRAVNATTDEVIVKTLKARGRCDFGRENWTGHEIFTVTYEDSGRGASAKIVKIVGDLRQATVLDRSGTGNNKLTWRLNSEDISITKTGTAGVYEFTYENGMELDKTSSRTVDNRRNDNRGRVRTENKTTAKNEDKKTVAGAHDAGPDLLAEDDPIDRDTVTPRPTTTETQFTALANITASGTVNIANADAVTWSITHAAVDYSRSRNNREPEIITLLTIANVTNLTLVCGRPVGQFPAVQSVPSSKGEKDFQPAVTVQEDGTIVSLDLRATFQTNTCKMETPDTAGFRELMESLVQAESIATRPVDLSAVGANADAQVRRTGLGGRGGG